ncbi:hypothetical protein LCGC14_2511990 [marine sediment metagenome]|uniref:Uncharacterized protein n=1 Tax=marine sediment metagenome TaxID=412755 RepID=A0A0F9AYW2_9ZZZZ
MGEQVHTLDNAGHLMPPDPSMTHPVAASGITLAMATAGTDYTQDVEQGQSYAVTFVATAAKFMLLSITGVTSVAANREWVIMANDTAIIHIPIGKTTLYVECDESSKNAYLRKLAD